MQDHNHILALPSSKLLVSGVACGYFVHQYVKRVEVDRHPLSILSIVVAAPFVLAFGLRHLGKYEGYLLAYQSALMVESCAVLSLWMNTLIYRAFSHPLKEFPGPFGAKLSKFWSLKQVIDSKVRWYQVVGELKNKYGDYVRTGPRELVIFDPEAIVPILGFNSKTRKGPFYGAMEQSLHTTRDHDFHKMRRKVWDLAFKQTLADYGPSIEEFTDSLLARVASSGGKPLALNDLCIHYSYDVMSALAFGDSTRFLEGKSTKTATKILDNIREGIVAVGALLHVPWILTVVESISFAGPMMEFNRWSAEQVDKRSQMKNPRPDIMGHLLEHTEDTAAGRRLLNADSRVIIGAGSDTTASALTVLFVLLATNPSYQKKLRDEVEIIFANSTYNSAKPQVLLDGIINEALRLYPPVTFLSQRVTPAEGLTIGKVHIPPDTVVSVGTFSIHHDARNFLRPDEFIPERWSSQPDLILNKSAFIPFSVGAYNCPGRGLAMMELRSVISRTVQEFDISTSDMHEFDTRGFFDGIKDHFTSGVPRCEMVFQKR
ncbi:Cytokinin biosynthesis 2 [Hyphodiscus hymeniophilus]|uniref:Cytokinin biosynthesis 2 n=1 Tax=Hyphodiscus hymeniophilus TaxID=353542 RepID=A0A9P6VE33_9HELO|nr:Cytokinin biosynthesis 2 [Hyphodiscus hymeniophilus]